MPVFLICFIVFIIWLRVKLKQNNSSIEEANAAFWEREERANYARKKDISVLDYLTVPENALPFGEPLDERDRDLQADVKDRMARKMIDLSDYTNTELKEQYGVVNLEELSNCDQNYMYFIRTLSIWGKHLYDLGEYSRSRQIMEYSLSINSDISTVYTTLGAIYAQNGELQKIDDLIGRAENSDIDLKDSIIRKLKLCKLEN